LPRRELYWWHPLVSGDPDVHAAGYRWGRTVSETQYGVAELEERIVAWPGKSRRRQLQTS
jgi:uncharacterized cysteine cluster protein YcgN (CxxCxxCC family)